MRFFYIAQWMLLLGLAGCSKEMASSDISIRSAELTYNIHSHKTLDQRELENIKKWLSEAKEAGIQPYYGKHGYPTILQLTLSNGETVMLQPAYECTVTERENGVTKSCCPVKHQVAISYSADGKDWVRVQSDELYEWLMKRH